MSEKKEFLLSVKMNLQGLYLFYHLKQSKTRKKERSNAIQYIGQQTMNDSDI